MTGRAHVATGVRHINATLPRNRRRGVVLTLRRVGADDIPDHGSGLSVQREEVAIGCAAKHPALGVADASHGSADAETLGLKVVTPPLLGCAGVDGIQLGTGGRRLRHA
jgi:hypothetical protein